MEQITLKEDKPVFYKVIDTFPLGIQQGFEELVEKFGVDHRVYYGISYMDKDCNIVYKAAVTEKDAGEGLKNGYEPFTIRKGDYLSETLLDWMPNTDQIKDIFGRMMEDPRFDDTYPCVEFYKNDQVMECWVRVKGS